MSASRGVRKKKKAFFPFVVDEQLLPLQDGSAGRYTVAVRSREEERKSDKSKRKTGEGVVRVLC
jgi:hypothetical protein